MTIMNPIQINLRVTEPLQQALRQATANDATPEKQVAVGGRQ
jgi:hypothetical protein